MSRARLYSRSRLLPRASAVAAAWLTVGLALLGSIAATAALGDELLPSITWLSDDFGVGHESEYATTSYDTSNTEQPVAAQQLPAPQEANAENPWIEEPSNEPLIEDDYEMASYWTWQWLPTGLIYRSYQAGPREPRMGINTFSEDGRALWDATLGGRVGFWRYGTCDPIRPQGYQLDFYGAAISRLDVDHRQDLDSADYVFGVPLTYGVDDWQFKFGYAHVSSHLGDERARRVPGALDDRLNYVRDGFVLGASNYPVPACRVYGEVGWAFNADGGAEPWETQWGTEISIPGPTGKSVSPFLAINAHLFQEYDFGGNLAAQAGWLRRGLFGQTLRFGVHYLVGKTTQAQFFNSSEEQIGLGLWYDM